MKRKVKVNFAYFWPGFSLAWFEEVFPCVIQHYDLELSSEPDVLFFSLHDPKTPPQQTQHGQYVLCMPTLPAERFLRVFIAIENVEPIMDRCDFAISLSPLVDHPNHLRLPMWAYPGLKPQSLVKSDNTDWEKVAAEKTRFCNFVYSHDVAFRNHIFHLLNAHRRVDSAGSCLNNMNGCQVPHGDHTLDFKAKLNFIGSYKFTLAVENAIWPGYQTEKIVHPKYVNSIPIYVGDPLARNVFDTAGYVDITCFRTLREMIEFVLAVDSDRKLYMEMLSAPHYRNNLVPSLADEAEITRFFDRIFGAAANFREASAHTNEALCAKVAKLDAERGAAMAELNQMRAECDAFRRSTSWQITAPLRWLRNHLP